MLRKLDVKTRRGTTISFEMFENDSGFQVAEIEGLDPVKATLVSSRFAGMDGEEFQSARREPRNIKISIDLEPNYLGDTYASLRKKLYSFFMPKSHVTLRLHQDTGLYVDIDGVVEDVEGPVFSQDPDITVSLMCYKPDFVDPRKVVVPGVSTSGSNATVLSYPGNVETGTVLTLKPARPLNEFGIYNTTEDGRTSRLDFAYPLVAGDLLVVSSVKGAKRISLTRSNATTSVLYGRTPQSGWIELFEGDNQFRVYAAGDPVPYDLEYFVRYGGL